jgi:hypothetical protein
MNIKKVPSHREKINLLRIARLILLTTITLHKVITIAESHAQETPISPPGVACGVRTGITLPLSDTWQISQISYPSLLCAFRNKNGGFPTLNIVQDAAPGASPRPGVLARETLVKNEYQKVGLTDAVVSDSHTEPLGTLEAFHTTARYMNQGIPMESLIMIVDLPDRTLTVTVLDPADHPIFSKTQLQELLRGIRITGATDQDPPPPFSPRVGTPAIIFLIVIIGVFLVILGVRQARRTVR